MTYTYMQVLNKMAAKTPVEEEEYDMDALVEEWRQARKQRELGYGGAFVRSLPISRLLAGLAVGIPTGAVAGHYTGKALFNNHLNNARNS